MCCGLELRETRGIVVQLTRPSDIGRCELRNCAAEAQPLPWVNSTDETPSPYRHITLRQDLSGFCAFRRVRSPGLRGAIGHICPAVRRRRAGSHPQSLVAEACWSGTRYVRLSGGAPAGASVGHACGKLHGSRAAPFRVPRADRPRTRSTEPNAGTDFRLATRSGRHCPIAFRAQPLGQLLREAHPQIRRSHLARARFAAVQRGILPLLLTRPAGTTDVRSAQPTTAESGLTS